MDWKTQLRPGRFRDAPFHVAEAVEDGGRRTAVHQFPQRDGAAVEDLGVQPRAFTVDCFVLGPDYFALRDRLIAALSEAGPGALVHPYRGALVVSCLGYSVRESTDEGGIARFSLRFLEARSPALTSVAADAAARVETAAAAAGEAARSGLETSVRANGFAAHVAESAAANVRGVADRLQAALDRVNGARQRVSRAAQQIRELRAGALTLVRAAPDLAGTVAGLITSIRLVADTPRAALRELKGLIGWRAGPPSPGATPARIAVRGNQAAIERLVSLSAAAEAVLAARAVAFDSYDDAVSVRDDLVERLDAQALFHADGGDDAAWRALEALRLAITADITERGGSLARLLIHRPPEPLPALVLAHRLYGDAGREAELVARNRLRHPGFVAGPLEVRSDG